MDRLAIEIMEDISIPGRVFFQLLSGVEHGHFSVQTLGSFCFCKGRFVLQHKWLPNRRIYVPYQCTLDCAENVVVKDVTGTETASFVPNYLKTKRIFSIKANNFPSILPLELVSVDLVLASYKERKDLIHHHRKEKFVFLFRSQVHFKAYEEISLSNGYSSQFYTIKDILFDKMTLFSASVTLPCSQAFKELQTTPTGNMNTTGIAAEKTPKGTRDRIQRGPKIQNVNVQSLSEKLQVIFLEGNIAMDIFLYLMILIIWLICHGEDLSLRQTILFMFIMAVLLINSRTVASFLLKRSFSRADKGSVETSNERSFFVNGWNAWSFCGSVRQGENPPVYAMPSIFVKAFHHGGVGTSLPINLGEGDIPISASYFTKHGRTFHQGKVIQPNFTLKEIKANRDHIASDMFTLLADLQSQYGLVIGFLSQRQHFGCISTNRNYDRMSIHISGDGVKIPSQGSFTTDVLAIYAVSSLDDPFSIYTSMTSDEHQVRKKLSADIISGLSYDLGEGSKTQLTTKHSVFSPINIQGKSGTNSFQPISPQGNLEDGLFSSNKNNPLMNEQSDDMKQLSQVPVGWCSWYHFFRNINETNLYQNIELMKEYQEKYSLQTNNHQGKTNNLFQLFQIDDGYQLHWGDWMEVSPSFSSSRSMTNIVEKIHDAGLLSGIWLAPFAADKDANIVKKHPDWILRKREIASHTSSWLIWLLKWIFYPIVYLFSSWPSNSANCGKFFYGLDITHPSFQEYVIDVFHTITRDWGIRYLKLDFLYAAVLQDAQHSYYDRSLTRAQIMQLGMKIINESLRRGNTLKQKLRKKRRFIKKRGGGYGSRDLFEEDEGEGLCLEGSDDEEEGDGRYFLLGCGSALGSMIGHVHANRISPDAGLTWEAEIPFCHHDKWNLPSARTMIRNTVNRLFMHNKWWINDPDCLLLRDELPFTEDEIIGITTVKALSGGSILISDDLAKISSKRFRLMQQLLPPTNTAATAVDLMDKETPELFRIVFISNHYKRTLEQQKLQRRKMRDAFSKAGTEPDKPFSPSHLGETPPHINPSLFSPFETVLYSKRHPQSPLLSRISSPMASKAHLSMLDSLDFVETKRSFAELHLNDSQEEEDDEDKLQNDSFDETLEEDHAILHSVDGKIAKGTPVTTEMRCQGIKEKWLDKRDLLKRWILFTVCNWSDPVNEGETEKTESMDRSSSVDSVTSTTSTLSSGIAASSPSSKVIKGKTQFVSLKSIFTEEILNEFIEYTTFLYDPTRKNKKIALKTNGGSGLNSPSRSGVFPANPYNPSKRSLSARQLLHYGSASSLLNDGASAPSPGDTFRNTTPATPRSPALSIGAAIQIKHILHLFNFWNQTYSYRIINIMNGADGDVSIVNTVGGVSNHNENNNDNNEIAFPDVPYHSAHIYSVQLSLHPLLPKYLGSNFHFSCGLEIRHCFLTETLPSSKKALEIFSEDYLKQRLQQEEEERKEFEEIERFELAAESQSNKKGSSRHRASSLASSSVASSRGGSFTGISVNTSFSRGMFTPKARGRYRHRRNIRTSPHPTLASAFSGSITYNSFSPVVQTMCIAFEDGILKDDAWDGFIWLYLPVNIKRAKIFYQLLGKVEISGSAWSGNESNILSEERVKVVDYIEETSCRAAGYVYRIKVVSSKFNQQGKQNEQMKLEEDIKHLTKSRRTRSGYISATSTIDEEDSYDESGSRDEVKADAINKKKEEDMKEIDALAKPVESDDDKDGEGSLSSESYHPSLSMSATFENIGLSGLVPKPLKTRFDASDPGIFLSRSASFMIMNKSHGSFNLPAGTEGMKANYSSPSKPLKIANVVNLQKGSDDLDYLMVSWISDMEENVVRVDSPTALFS